MTIRGRRPSAGTIFGLAALAVAVGGVAYAAIPDSGGTIHACYQKSNGGLSCLTCHDAHDDASRDPKFYAAKCGTCHAANKRPPASQCSTTRGGDCASCHMPRVEAMPHMEFSNHWIGIYPASGGLVPRRRS